MLNKMTLISGSKLPFYASNLQQTLHNLINKYEPQVMKIEDKGLRDIQKVY